MLDILCQVRPILKYILVLCSFFIPFWYAMYNDYKSLSMRDLKVYRSSPYILGINTCTLNIKKDLIYVMCIDLIWYAR